MEREKKEMVYTKPMFFGVYSSVIDYTLSPQPQSSREKREREKKKRKGNN